MEITVPPSQILLPSTLPPLVHSLLDDWQGLYNYCKTRRLSIGILEEDHHRLRVLADSFYAAFREHPQVAFDEAQYQLRNSVIVHGKEGAILFPYDLFIHESHPSVLPQIVCMTFDLDDDKTFPTSFWEDYVLLADRFIFVIDRADPDKLEEAYQWLIKVIQWTQPAIPILLLWNKSDLPEFIPFAEAYRRIDSFPEVISRFPQIQVWEGSVLQSQDYSSILNWFTVSIEHHSLTLPTRFQALRVYFKAPEFVVAEAGHISAFDTAFELIQQTLLPPNSNSRVIPLCGGNYLIWQSSDQCHCLAIFPEKTLPELGQITVSTTLVLIEKRLQNFKKSVCKTCSSSYKEKNCQIIKNQKYLKCFSSA